MVNIDDYGLLATWIKDIDFKHAYFSIVKAVRAEPQIIFTPEVEAKTQSIGEDFSAYKGLTLKDFFKESPSGTVFTPGKRYAVDKQFFKIINIACYEYILQESQKFEAAIVDDLKNDNFKEADINNAIYLFRRKFFSEIFEERKKHHRPNHLTRGIYYYDNLDEYINSCINTAILSIEFLRCREKTVYTDYSENRASKNTTI